MACLQNGTSILNNNLSSFKHNIMKYDENHSNMWSNTSQINSFLNKNCQIPFRINHTKEKSNIFIKDEVHSCIQDDVIPVIQPSDNESKEINQSTPINTSQNDQLEYNYNSSSVTLKLNTAHDKNESANNKLQFYKIPEASNNTAAINEEDNWISSENKLNDSYIYDNNFSQNEISSENQSTIIGESEIIEPSHHARRPMNAFLIFCKRHRTVVKDRYPHLENRAVTKILGEWWAALETEEKACYTELAKQYKNAFFNANPNFKWYKLPAPPLRTLNTRPANIIKSPPLPKQSPNPEVEEKQQQQLFTPGKLADETQLGSITSLINCDNQHTNGNVVKTTPQQLIGKNSSDTKPDEQTVLSPMKSEYKNYLSSPPPSSNIELCQPLKPFKKRMLHNHKDNKNIVRSIFCTNDAEKKPERNIFDSSLLDQALENFVDNVNNDESDMMGNFRDNTEKRPFINNTNSNFTQQEIINKVVDHMCSSKTDSNDSNNDDFDDSDCNSYLQNDDSNSKETRKSVRSCKGLRYAKFMAEGKLFVNKRNKKHMSATKLPKPSYASSNASDKVPRNTESIELNETIKKLAERTMGSFAKIAKPQFEMDHNENSPEIIKHETTIHEPYKMFRAADFNLDEKIEALPSLSLDKFQQKKKENKKRKILRATKIKETTEQKKLLPEINRSECDKSSNTYLTGSRKRKPRKQSITRIGLKQPTTEKQSSSAELDLFGLATLAEVAAKKAKIDQK